MIRRLRSFSFSTVAAVVLLGSCGKKTPTLNLLVWEGYADPSFVQAFEEKYHCKVSASYMGSSDELVAKLRGGSAGNYDVISPSSDVATTIAAAGLAAAARPVEDPQLQPALPATHFACRWCASKGKVYGVPSCGGPIRCIYDTTAFPRPPDSWTYSLGPEISRQDFGVG